MKRVIVTGATGFIGQWCVRGLLARGWHVCTISSKANQAPYSSQITPIQADLLNSHEHERVIKTAAASHLLHLSWCVEHSSFKTTRENIQHLTASIEFIKKFAELGGHRVVTAGSCMEYLWEPGQLREEAPCHPDTLYGICKHQLYQTMAQIAPILGLSYACGRIFFLYGPNENKSRFISSLIVSLLRGEKAHCKSANLRRDFLHVEDVADALVSLLLSERQGALNIGSGRATSLSSITSYLGKQLGKSHLIKLSQAASRPLSFSADITNLQSLWQPKISLWEGLDRTLSWWLSSLPENVR